MSFHGGLLGVVAALTLFAWRRRRNPWDVYDFTAPLPALGLFFAIKQYAVLLAPLAFLLVDARPGPVRRRETLLLLGKAVLLAAALTLPLALWNLPGFLNDVVLFQARQPFRIDSLSYAARWAMATGAH